MAITKLGCIKESSSGRSVHLYNALRYISNPEKTQGGRLVGGSCCMPDWRSAYDQMMYTKKVYKKMDMRQGYHFIISFHPDEPVSPELAFEITKEFVDTYLGEDYEALYSVHDDKDHIHGHIVFNSVSRTTGLKYHYANGDWKRNIQPIVNNICRQHGLSALQLEFAGFVNDDGEIIDATADELSKTMHHGRNLNRHEWELRKKSKLSWSDFVKADIDALLPACSSWDELVAALENMGWIVNDKTKDGGRFLKHFSLKPPLKDSRAIRPDKQCGYGYSREGIIERIENKIYGDIGDTTFGNFAESTEKGAEGWDWNQVYSNDNYRKYHNTYQRIQKQFIKKPQGYKPGLTDYQKKHVANLYRTKKMERLALNKIPMKFRPNLIQLSSLQEQTLYIFKHNIKSEDDLVTRMVSVQNSIRSLSKERHKLYGLRWSAKEALAFSYSFFKDSGKMSDSSELEERFKNFGKNLERQELAIELLSFLSTSGNFAETDIKKFVKKCFESGDYIVETEEGFLQYLRINRIEKESNWIEKTTVKLERLAYTKQSLGYRNLAIRLMDDVQLVSHPSYYMIKKQLKEYGLEEKKISDFLAAMNEIDTSGKIAESEDIRLKLLHLSENPERNTKAIDFIKELKNKYPSKEQYLDAVRNVLEAGNYDLSSLDAFMESFKNGESEILEKQKELEKEFELCQQIRKQHFSLPKRKQNIQI